MKRCSGTYYILVVEDTTKSQIIGSATLVLEQKFIHSAGTVRLLLLCHSYNFQPQRHDYDSVS